MSQEKQSPASVPSSVQTGRAQSPSPTEARYRPPLRASTIASVGNRDLRRRRSSLFSETLSETHRSFRTSTDDLLLPRVQAETSHEDQLETSHWHSIPLGLALLPAVGGLFFRDGSAVVTDITLLGLAAIFLNWSLRLPWEWYRAAQSTAPLETLPPVVEESENDIDGVEEDAVVDGDDNPAKTSAKIHSDVDEDAEAQAAQNELRIHELVALLACFIFPLLGAWLLHAIRSQLSRPSEGLVSNYNLTIFLLVAELRPLSHLLKLVQRRTLFLQRKINASVLQEQQDTQQDNFVDMAKRLEELEAHVADAVSVSTAVKSAPITSPDAIASKAASQASTELRKAFQPELDALNRAMRRYEKRMTISAIQVESRLQDLEARLKDVVVLAAAAQRSADKRPRNYLSVLTNWACAVVVLPVQLACRVVALPGRLLQALLDSLRKFFVPTRKEHGSKDSRTAQRAPAPRPRVPQKKVKAAS